jgi:Nif-specific regulatory protein
MAESNQIHPRMLPAYLFNNKGASNLGVSNLTTTSRLEMMERETVLEALARNDWVQQRAAREIGLTLRQMGYRVKKFKLDKIIRENKLNNNQYKNLSH